MYRSIYICTYVFIYVYIYIYIAANDKPSLGTPKSVRVGGGSVLWLLQTLTTKVRIGRGYLWGSFLIAAAALKTPTRNGYNAQSVNLNFCG